MERSQPIFIWSLPRGETGKKYAGWQFLIKTRERWKGVSRGRWGAKKLNIVGCGIVELVLVPV